MQKRVRTDAEIKEWLKSDLALAWMRRESPLTNMIIEDAMAAESQGKR